MESARHKALKAYLQDFFAAQGWAAEQEVYSAQHPLRPDVLVSTDQHQRQAAFEVELSKTAYRSLLARQKKYQAAGIKVIWLLARQPRQGASSLKLPFFVLGPEPASGRATEEIVAVDHRWLTIEAFLQSLATESLSWRRGQPELRRSGYLVTFPGYCWVCQQQFTAIRGLQAPTCRCGKYLDYPEDLNEAVFAAVIDHSPVFQRLEPRFGPLARLQRRRSKLAPEPYIANHCPHCRKLQGNFFLHPGAAGVLYGLESGRRPEEALSAAQLRALGQPMQTGGLAPGQMEALAVPGDVFSRRPPAESSGHWCLQLESKNQQSIKQSLST